MKKWIKFFLLCFILLIVIATVVKAYNPTDKLYTKTFTVSNYIVAVPSSMLAIPGLITTNYIYNGSNPTSCNMQFVVPTTQMTPFLKAAATAGIVLTVKVNNTPTITPTVTATVTQ